ncbi:MAG TPA: malectin domain-containing carbohydrate-binding protein [Tepidisphaeraceae bacterium]|nr:malectin domain-containing carbohydrate-binding protein [Tepidisphaeraceae bacterium]
MLKTQKAIDNLDRMGPANDDALEDSNWPWLRRGVALILIYFVALGIAALCGGPSTTFAVAMIPFAFAGAFIVELFVLRQWNFYREQSLNWRKVEAQALLLLDLERPPLSVRLAAVHLGFLARWFRENCRWSMMLGLFAGATGLGGCAFLVWAVWLANLQRDHAASLAAGTGAALILIAVILVFHTGRAIAGVGRSVRRLAVTRDIHVVESPAALRPGEPVVLRFDAGGPGFSDSDDQTWQVGSGFTGGTSADRGAIAVARTSTAQLYRHEQWGMTAFNQMLPNGVYIVNLYFAETDPAVSAAAQRVFTYAVQGAANVTLDIFQEAGGSRIALVKTHRVIVENEHLTITFAITAPKAMDAVINGIEIIRM